MLFFIILDTKKKILFISNHQILVADEIPMKDVCKRMYPISCERAKWDRERDLPFRQKDFLKWVTLTLEECANLGKCSTSTKNFLLMSKEQIILADLQNFLLPPPLKTSTSLPDLHQAWIF